LSPRVPRARIIRRALDSRSLRSHKQAGPGTEQFGPATGFFLKPKRVCVSPRISSDVPEKLRVIREIWADRHLVDCTHSRSIQLAGQLTRA